MSSDNVEIKIGSHTVDAEELVSMVEDGTLYEFLEADLKIMSDTERSAFIEDVNNAVQTACDQLDTVIDGIDDEIDELDDDLQESSISRKENEIEELEELVDALACNVPTAVQECVEKVGTLYVRTNEDVTLSPTVDYENGEVISITATGGSAGIFESDTDEVLTDLDEDGMITYRDEEARVAANASSSFENNQDIFLMLEPEDTVTNITFSGEKAIVTIANSAKGTTVTVEIDGIKEGVHLYFDSSNENFISESLYKSLPEELTRLMYFGNDMKSVYENLNTTTEDAELDFIDGFDEILAAVPDICTQYSTSGSAMASYVEEGLKTIFGYLNDPTASDITTNMSSFISSISGLPQQDQEDILTSLVMTMATQAGQTYFQTLLGGNVAALIENVFLADAVAPNTELNNTEKMICMVLEMHSGGAGRYGGADAFWNAIFVALDDGSGTIELSQAEWQDIEANKEALEMYRNALSTIPWGVDNGGIDAAIGQLDAMQEAQADPINGTMDQYTASINDAIAALESDGWAKAAVDADLADGITGGNWASEIKCALNTMTADGAATVQQMVTNLLAYFGTLDSSHDGDVAAGVVYYLYKFGGDLGKELLKTVVGMSGIKTQLQNLIQDEMGTWSDPAYATEALDYLSKM